MASFMGHGEVALRYWHLLRAELPELQLVLWDEERDAVVGHARTLPARVAEGLPGGVDDMLEAWFGEGRRPEPDVLSAMVAVVDRSRQGEGLSTQLVEAMGLARAHGYPALVAPVRPTWKERYPLIPMERATISCRARSSRCASRTAAASTSSRTSGCATQPDPLATLTRLW